MRAKTLYLFCILLITFPAVAAQPDEKNCTQAITSAQKMLNEMPAKTPRDQEDLRELKAKQERLIAEGRRNGKSECEIWSAVMGNAFNQ